MEKGIINYHCFGARGSVPVLGRAFDHYGGATSCYYVSFHGGRIFLDGGSGLGDPKACDYCTKDSAELVFVTHLHLDHVLGLPYLDGLKIRGHSIKIYVPDEASVGKLSELFGPPFWPIALSDFPADVEILPMPSRVEVRDCVITSMEGNHPGGSRIYRIDHPMRSLVYATDYEHDGGEKDEELIAFARGADVLLYDGAYTQKEYELYRGYGHSTPDRGAYIAGQAGVKRLIITHHAPDHDDVFVEQMEKEFREKYPGGCFAYAGMSF